MNEQELQNLRRLLDRLRDDIDLGDDTVYRGTEIQAVDDLAVVQLESLLPTTAGTGGLGERHAF